MLILAVFRLYSAKCFTFYVSTDHDKKGHTDDVLWSSSFVHIFDWKLRLFIVRVNRRSEAVDAFHPQQSR